MVGYFNYIGSILFLSFASFSNAFCVVKKYHTSYESIGGVVPIVSKRASNVSAFLRNEDSTEEEKKTVRRYSIDANDSLSFDARKRRHLLVLLLSTPMPFLQIDKIHLSRANAISFPFGPGEERRQLELCLVTTLRVRYWAEKVSLSIKRTRENAPASGSGLTDALKGPYLEARLGAKALVTGKVGGGANSRVLTLAPLKLRECLKDGEFWFKEYYLKNEEDKGEARKKKFFLDAASQEIIESLAAVVEFDGLETITDPSPRSSLTLAMYNDNKAAFIQRMLLERTVPNCDTYVNSFGRERRESCERFIIANYPDELPVKQSFLHSSVSANNL